MTAKADKFKSEGVPGIKGRFIRAVAITGSSGGDQTSILGPDKESAMRSAFSFFGPSISILGAQRVVVMAEDRFLELVASRAKEPA